MLRVLAAFALILAGCHLRERISVTRPGDSHAEIHADQPRALPATVVVTDDGHLRFVTPLRCPADVFVAIETGEQVTVSPNLATFVVGVVVTALGAVALARGGAEDAPASSGWSYLGGAGVIVGLPLVIGPWIGNGVDEVPHGSSSLRKGASEEPCGERPVVARAASVRIGRQRVVGTVDDDGRFSVSPFELVDVFAIGELPALDLAAEVTGDDGAHQTIDAVVEASALAGAAAGWIAATGVDARKETLRKIPRLEAGVAKVARLVIDGQPTLRVVLPLRNDGPGDAWQVRVVVSSDQPELDGRVGYLGHLGAGGAADLELAIPLSAAASADLTGVELELDLQIRAADGTGPESPVKFRGHVLDDLPR